MRHLKEIEKRLHGAILRQKTILILAGILALVSTVVGTTLILFGIAALIIIPVPVKLTLISIGIIAVAFTLYRYLYKPVRAHGSLTGAAIKVEKNHPELKGRLIAALQFQNYDLEKTNFSPVLMEMTGKQAIELTNSINFNEIVSGFPLFQKLKYGTAIIALAVIFGILVPGLFSKGFEVYSQPTTRVAPPPGFSVEVSPGDAERVKYSDIEIGGLLIGLGFPDEVEVFYRYIEGRWQSEKLEVKSDNSFAINGNGLIHADTIPYGLTLNQVRRSFDYYITAGEIQSPIFKIDIVERPRVTNLKLSVNYPKYTGLKKTALDENNGSFAALVGSRAYLEIEANREIKNGYLMRNDSVQLPVTFDKSRGVIDFGIGEDFSYHIRLLDSNGETNPAPIEYMVTAIPDEYPYITVVYPGYDINLDDRMVIPFELRISDDFGFNSLAMKYQIISGGARENENVAVINFSEDIKTEGEISFNWDVDRFNLLPSDIILYHFELADNDAVSGPKITSTREYAARLPSIDEIIAETENQQEVRIFESEKILSEQKEMADKLQQLIQEIKVSNKADWQKSKELENLLGQQNKTVENLEKMAEEMDKSIEQMEQNNLLSEQIMKKMMELQNLFKEIATPEMKEAMKRLAEALKNMSPEELEKAMEDFQVTQEEMLKRLERTVALLKKMQIEQKMAAMQKMAEEMLLEQNRVNVETQQSKSNDDNPRLAQREKNLQKQMSALKKESEKLKKLLDESDIQDSEPHNQFIEAVKQNQAGTDMNQMEQKLNADNREEALPQGEMASEKLSQLVDEMQTIADAIGDSEGKKLAQEMIKSINDAVYLSKEQEELKNSLQNGSRQVDNMRNLAGEQLMLQESINGLIQKIDEIGKKSPFMAAEVRSMLEQSRNNMDKSCNSLGERRVSAALDQQHKAMYNLNQASVKLLDGLESQKNCNKGGSCDKGSQKMQSLCQKQNKINKKTQGQCNKPGGNKEGNESALKRLASEQGAVRKSLQDLQNEFGNRRDILGRLDALTDEIKEIEELLDEGSLGGEIVDRQIRVYSRMLDVQKSLNRRNFTRERQAITGNDIIRMSPGALEDANRSTQETLQDRINKYLQEGFPRQYEQQIKAYFKGLSGIGQNVDKDE